MGLDGMGRDGTGWDGMVIICYRSSMSTFGTNNFTKQPSKGPDKERNMLEIFRTPNGKKRDRKKDERYAEKKLLRIVMKVCERKTCRKEFRRRRRLGRQSQWQETQRWLKKKVKVKDEQQRPPGCDWGRNSKLKTYRF